jgi:predicted RNA binding protein YcfA (HicA-like mRNA interferase family)
MNGYYDLVVKQLKAHGYTLLRQTGSSHQIWTNGVHNQTVSTNCYSRHTANAIMRQAGISQRF